MNQFIQLFNHSMIQLLTLADIAQWQSKGGMSDNTNNIYKIDFSRAKARHPNL